MLQVKPVSCIPPSLTGHEPQGQCRDTASPNSKPDLVPGAEPCCVVVAVESPRPHHSLFSCTHSYVGKHRSQRRSPSHRRPSGISPGGAKAHRACALWRKAANPGLLLTLQLANSKTLGKLLNPSGAQFPYVKLETHKNAPHPSTHSCYED